MRGDFIIEARREAARQARTILRQEFVIFDTETTGLEAEYERIVSIGVVDHEGNVLLDALINPGVPVGATFIHGITDEMVQDAPRFADIWPALYDALEGRVWVGYNVRFDKRFLYWECQRAGLRMPPPALDSWRNRSGWWDRGEAVHCAMHLYAEFYGAFSDYHGSFTWQKLVNACRDLGITIQQAHHATHDALATLAVLRGMATYD